MRALPRLIVPLALLALLQACGGNPTRNPPQDAAQANLNLGVAYVRQQRFDLAVSALERALAQDPRLAPAHSTIALAHDRLGNAEQAEEHYLRALRLDSSDPSTANGYAVFLCRQSRWADAEPYFRQAASNPRYATPAAALTNAGMCAQQAGALEDAETYFREALARDRAYPDALSGMMEISAQRGEYLQARAFLQRYHDASAPTDASLRLCVTVERALDDRVAAEQCLEQLRGEFPGSRELQRAERNDR